MALSDWMRIGRRSRARRFTDGEERPKEARTRDPGVGLQKTSEAFRGRRLAVGLVFLTGLLGLGLAGVWAYQKGSWEPGDSRHTVGAFPQEVPPVVKELALRCRRWRPGDLRLGLREAWCGVGTGAANQVNDVGPPAVSSGAGPLEIGTLGKNWIQLVGAGGNSEGAPDPHEPQFSLQQAQLAEWHVPELTERCLRAEAGTGPARRVGFLRGRREDSPRADPVRPPPFWTASRPGLLALRLTPGFLQVKRYLEEALAERPIQEFRGRLLFERRERFRWGVSWRRCILDSPAGGVRLQWFANDDYGMSELREFFEAPFFSEAETEQFYRWLGRWGWHEGPFRHGAVWMGVLPGDGLIFVEIFWKELGG